MGIIQLLEKIQLFSHKNDPVMNLKEDPILSDIVPNSGLSFFSVAVEASPLHVQWAK